MIARVRPAGGTWAASSELHVAVSDFLESMKIAKGYGAEERHAAEFGRLSRRLGEQSLVAAAATSRSRQWLSVGSAGLLAVAVYVAHTLLTMSAASLFLLMFLFARLVPRLTSLYERLHALAIELPGFEAVVAAEKEALAAAEPPVVEHRALSYTVRNPSCATSASVTRRVGRRCSRAFASRLRHGQRARSLDRAASESPNALSTAAHLRVMKLTWRRSK